MNRKIQGARENRKAILTAVGRALSDHALTKVELQDACPQVVIDNNTLEMLRNSGAITITRGRYAKISLACPVQLLWVRFEEFLIGMKRNSEKEEAVERRVLTEKSELKAAFKRAKAGEALLQEKITSLEKLVAKLEKENTMLKEKLGAIKLIIK